MKYAFSVTNIDNMSEMEREGLKLLQLIKNYSASLNNLMEIKFPKGIVFHDFESATQVFSSIPLPAYTSRELIHITPLPKVWREIFLSVTNDKNTSEAQKYFKKLDIIDVATIAAHELTHHSEIFHDDFDKIDEDNKWFEEGMCFYLPRKIMMSENKFEKIMSVENELIKLYNSKFGNYVLSEFGKSASKNNYASILYDYWRSTNVVRRLVEIFFNGDVKRLLEFYKSWINIKNTQSLHRFIVKNLNIPQSEAKKMWLLD
ncbi:hypothetical protein BHF71_09950 [Vulcanibacillus modesticaldus]|uniref:DUF2268 domain-containing protein n=1 Tax=Vulcanibacillus modesticaldus TaxID=337097 RepID=A0A1D2YTH1_9BACI|nr:hypothetical protein [Vulcanibacillus modesticaldus]OEF99002.1 hypothetical protein BHF71_09950 [Vulcanibacillus modesticaldus]